MKQWIFENFVGDIKNEGSVGRHKMEVVNKATKPQSRKNV